MNELDYTKQVFYIVHIEDHTRSSIARRLDISPYRVNKYLKVIERSISLKQMYEKSKARADT